jgi:hypothetical protein
MSVGKSGGKRPFGGSRRSSEINNKDELKAIGCEVVDSIYLAHIIVP